MSLSVVSQLQYTKDNGTEMILNHIYMYDTLIGQQNKGASYTYPLISELQQSESPVVLHRLIRHEPLCIIDADESEVVLLVSRAGDTLNQLQQLRVARIVGIETRSL